MTTQQKSTSRRTPVKADRSTPAKSGHKNIQQLSPEESGKISLDREGNFHVVVDTEWLVEAIGWGIGKIFGGK